MASNLYNTASVLVPKGAAGRASVIDAYRPAFNVLQSIGITRNDANGSFRNQQGLIEFAAANVPRFNWDEGDSCPKLLVEPSRENLLTYSEDFSTNWILTNGALSASGTNPEGNTAVLFEGSGSSTSVRIQQGVTVTVSNYQLSFFAKQGTERYIAVLLSGIDGSATAYFDLQEGFVTSDTSSGASMENYGNGWYRCILPVSATGPDVAGDANIFLSPDGLTNVYGSAAATSGQNVFIYGGQLEEGSYATSYIKTEATTQTRNADVISQTGLASLIGDSEGTLYVEAEYFDTPSGVSSRITLSSGLTNNRVLLYLNSGTPTFQVDNSSGLQAQMSSSQGAITAGTIYKIAGAYSVNDFVLYQDGVQAGTDISGSTFADGTLTTFKLSGAVGLTPFYGKISVLAWWQARLDNDVLESLTSYETYEEMAATLDYTID